MAKPRLTTLFQGHTSAMKNYTEGLRLLGEGTADAALQKKARHYIDRLETILEKLPIEFIQVLESSDVELAEMRRFSPEEGLSIQDAVEIDLAAYKKPAGSA